MILQLVPPLAVQYVEAEQSVGCREAFTKCHYKVIGNCSETSTKAEVE